MLKKLNDIIKKGFFTSLCELTFKVGESKWFEQFKFSKELVQTLTSASGGEISNIDFLDDEYLDSYGGDLIANKYLLRQTNTNGEITQASQWSNVFKVAYARYKTKWDKLWDVTKAQYNPIENYSMTEQEEMPTKTTELQHYEDYEVTTSENVNRDIHQEENADVERASDVYGFNSPSPVHVGVDNESKDKLNNYIDTNTSGLAEDNFVKETHLKDGDDNKEVTTESYDKKRELTRKGNIGVTTSQQMIESEIALWQWNFIQDVVYKDLSEMISISAFESTL